LNANGLHRSIGFDLPDALYGCSQTGAESCALHVGLVENMASEAADDAGE
jgi:hypothetical protein